MDAAPSLLTRRNSIRLTTVVVEPAAHAGHQSTPRVACLVPDASAAWQTGSARARILSRHGLKREATRVDAIALTGCARTVCKDLAWRCHRARPALRARRPSGAEDWGEPIGLRWAVKYAEQVGEPSATARPSGWPPFPSLVLTPLGCACLAVGRLAARLSLDPDRVACLQTRLTPRGKDTVSKVNNRFRVSAVIPTNIESAHEGEPGPTGHQKA